MLSNQMQLLCHGGKCCGAKHIVGFYLNPHSTYSMVRAEPRTVIKNNVPGAGAQGGTEAGKSFYRGLCPEEPPLKRLDRYLAFLSKHQPGGLVEVQLVSYQKTMWHEELVKRHFKVVTTYKNSNTTNMIYVYHRVNKRGKGE